MLDKDKVVKIVRSVFCFCIFLSVGLSATESNGLSVFHTYSNGTATVIGVSVPDRGVSDKAFLIWLMRRNCFLELSGYNIFSGCSSSLLSSALA